MAKVRGLPADFMKSVGDSELTEIKAAGRRQDQPAAAPPPRVPARQPPDSSGWVVWLLCVIILAVCVGFLFRDGLWSNAIRLVNVVFAGLLAMNFYEPAGQLG